MATVGYVFVLLLFISITCSVSCMDNASDGERIDDMEEDMLDMKIAIDSLEQKVLADKISLRTGLRKQVRQRIREAMSEMLQDGFLQKMMSAEIAAEMKQMKHSYHQMKHHLIHVSKKIMDLRDDMSVVQAAILKGSNSSASASGDNEMKIKQQNIDHMKSENKRLKQELAKMKTTCGSFNCTETDAEELTSMPLRTSTQQPPSNDTIAFPAECTKMAVPNFSFESKSSWLNLGDDWTLDTTEAQDGERSAKVTNGGVYQDCNFESSEFVFATPVRKFSISGYSKNVGGRKSIANPADYSLYCDLQKRSGSYLWGYNAAFTPGRNSWHRAQVNVSLSEDDAVIKAACYLLYRNSASVGAAYFDNVALYRLSDDTTDFTQCPTNQSKASTQPFSNECTKMAVPNFSFESKSSWLNLGDGWTLDTTDAQDGERSAKVTNGGVYQEFVFTTPVRKFSISGYSKNVGGRKSIANPADYSLYCDLKKTSGSYLWGYIAAFTPGRNSWHRAQVDVSLSEADAVVMAICHLLYRTSASVGAAYFDNVSLYRLSDDSTGFYRCQ
ncbi:uncharacterized protein [Haliotis asinina]|uniref:uncharacterized protein n=1 Tax=Haliotis asinina TaxID=109174 RepID=UPI003531AE0A